jgi:hypothetical protein
LPDAWSTPEQLANLIKEMSNQGRTPIHRLYIALHWGGGPANLTPITDAADSPDNDTNTLDNAKAKKGPPRSWFTRTARVYLLGCNTEAATQAWAGLMLRPSAVAYMGYGATQTLYTNYNETTRIYTSGFDSNGNMVLDPNDNPAPATTFSDLMQLPDWGSNNGGA